LGNLGLRGIQKITTSLQNLGVWWVSWCNWQVHPHWRIHRFWKPLSIFPVCYWFVRRGVPLITKHKQYQKTVGYWEGTQLPWHAWFDWLHALGMEKLSHCMACAMDSIKERKRSVYLSSFLHSSPFTNIFFWSS
jgi:hypothetical protein